MGTLLCWLYLNTYKSTYSSCYDRPYIQVTRLTSKNFDWLCWAWSSDYPHNARTRSSCRTRLERSLAGSLHGKGVPPSFRRSPRNHKFQRQYLKLSFLGCTWRLCSRPITLEGRTGETMRSESDRHWNTAIGQYF